MSRQEVIPADLAIYFELLDRQQSLFQAADSIMSDPVVSGAVIQAIEENFKQRDQVLAECKEAHARLIAQGWAQCDVYDRAKQHLAEKWGKR